MKARFLVAVGILVSISACSADNDAPARTKLAAILTDSLGAAADATPTYLRDESHLQIGLSAATFAGMDEASRQVTARKIAQFALRHYTRRAELDSISVFTREIVDKGIARILWSRSFPVTDLKNWVDVGVRLIAPDSATDEAGDVHTWYRVAVAARGREDTPDGVMADETPITLSAGRVTGLSFDSLGKIQSGYVFSTATHSLQRVRLPTDVSPFFSEASLSPDGKLLAYLSQDAQSRFGAVLCSWPSGAVLARANAGPGFPSDVDFNQVRWDMGGIAEYWVRIVGGTWVHISLSQTGPRHQDTTRIDPNGR